MSATSSKTPELERPDEVRQLEKTLTERVDALLREPSPTRLLEVAETAFGLKHAGFAQLADPPLRHLLTSLRSRSAGSEMADAAGFLLARTVGVVDGAGPGTRQAPWAEDLTSTPAAAAVPASDRPYRIEDYRNFGVIAHDQAGKATMAERILSCVGKTKNTADLQGGFATMAWDEPSQDSAASVAPAATAAIWNGKRFNVIDAPAPDDFALELPRSLRVLDGAVIVLDGAAGVEPQIETAWRLADEVPRIVFVDGMDRAGADFDRSVASIGDRLGVRAVPIQLPLGSGAGLKGVVDLLRMKAVVWDDDSGAAGRDQEIPTNLLNKALAARAHLVESLIEHDRDAVVAFRSGRPPSVETLKRSLRQGVLAGALHPVLCGSAAKGKGVQPMLDAVADYLPSPADAPPARGVDFKTGEAVTRIPSDAEPLSAWAFRVAHDPLVGSLTFCRIYSGKLQEGMNLLNATRDKRERVARILLMHADTREDVKQAGAGDVVALAGLKETCTGDTLCDPLTSPVILQPMDCPAPVIEIAVEPRSLTGQEALRGALRGLVADDPSLIVFLDPSGRTILKGASERQLEAKLDILKRDYGIVARVGAPRAAYLETITRPATIDYTHKKQTGGAAQFARVTIAFEPGKPGSGFVFESAIAGEAVPKAFIPGVQKGLEAARASGLLAGFPVVDFKATLVGGGHHDIDSTFLAFEIAARTAFQELRGKGEPRLLEPIMKVEVVAPEEHLGQILGDLSGRRGMIQDLDRRGRAATVTALVPLARLFGYAQDLRSLSHGLAQFTMVHDRYAPAPDTAATFRS